MSVPCQKQHPQLHLLGKADLLTQPTLALLCSARAPASILLTVHDLAQRWRQEGPTVMSGFQSTVEKEALDVLVRGPRPLVLWLARGLYRRVPPHLAPSVTAGRLLIVSPFDQAVHRATRETAIQRNRLLCATADAVLIAYAEPNSGTEALVQELTSAGKQVWTIAHRANEKLLTDGALPYCLTPRHSRQTDRTTRA